LSVESIKRKEIREPLPDNNCCRKGHTSKASYSKNFIHSLKREETTKKKKKGVRDFCSRKGEVGGIGEEGVRSALGVSRRVGRSAEREEKNAVFCRGTAEPRSEGFPLLRTPPGSSKGTGKIRQESTSPNRDLRKN